jgi:hypothetical protein
MTADFPELRARHPRPVVRDYDAPMPNPALLTAYNARLLDPAMATPVAAQSAPRSTVYIADRLLVSHSVDQPAVLAVLRAAGDTLGVDVVRLDGDDKTVRTRGLVVNGEAEAAAADVGETADGSGSAAQQDAGPDAAAQVVLGVTRGFGLRPMRGRAPLSLDAFTLLQTARAQAG